jgi:hypothetical protein
MRANTFFDGVAAVSSAGRTFEVSTANFQTSPSSATLKFEVSGGFPTGFLLTGHPSL